MWWWQGGEEEAKLALAAAPLQSSGALCSLQWQGVAAEAQTLWGAMQAPPMAVARLRLLTWRTPTRTCMVVRGAARLPSLAAPPWLARQATATMMGPMSTLCLALVRPPLPPVAPLGALEATAEAPSLMWQAALAGLLVAARRRVPTTMGLEAEAAMALEEEEAMAALGAPQEEEVAPAM